MRALPDTVLIAGGGLAGSRCAEALRGGGFQGRIVVACGEPEGPYERPALSKDFLSGRRSDASLALRDVSHWDELGVELLLGVRLAEVRPGARSATCSDGREIRWDALVVATGAHPRGLGGPAPGGVHVLRTLADAAALRGDLEPGRRLVVIGAGFVGLEVASTARALGVAVTVLGADELPLAGMFGLEVGRLIAARIHGHGVDLRSRTRVEGFDVGRDGRIGAVRIAGGELLPCDAALLAIGASPAAELGRGVCGLAADGGLRTDARGRTDVTGMYACGDVASTWRPALGVHRSIGHWTSAAFGASTVAGTILGHDAPAPELPYFWSDAFGLRLQHVGGHQPSVDQTLVDAAADGSSFEALYLRAGRPCAALLANRPERVAGLRRSLTSDLTDTVDHGLATSTTAG